MICKHIARTSVPNATDGFNGFRGLFGNVLMDSTRVIDFRLQIGGDADWRLRLMRFWLTIESRLASFIGIQDDSTQLR